MYRGSRLAASFLLFLTGSAATAIALGVAPAAVGGAWPLALLVIVFGIAHFVALVRDRPRPRVGPAARDHDRRDRRRRLVRRPGRDRPRRESVRRPVGRERHGPRRLDAGDVPPARDQRGPGPVRRLAAPLRLVAHATAEGRRLGLSRRTTLARWRCAPRSRIASALARGAPGRLASLARPRRMQSGECRERKLPPVTEPALFDLAGGMPFFESLVGRFYEGVASDPALLRRLPRARRPGRRPPPADAVPRPVLGRPDDLRRGARPSPPPDAPRAVRDRARASATRGFAHARGDRLDGPAARRRGPAPRLLRHGRRGDAQPRLRIAAGPNP